MLATGAGCTEKVKKPDRKKPRNERVAGRTEVGANVECRGLEAKP